MRSFQQLVLFFFALFAFALAQGEPASYDTTVYLTSTITRVNTVTMSGYPTGVPENSTSTISATHPAVPSASPAAPYPSAANGTVVVPSGSGTGPSAPAFTGAASSFGLNFYVAALAGAVGYLAL